MKASVLVIGAGNIAQAYDSIQGPEVRTHIKGYQYYGDFFSIKTLINPKSAVMHPTNPLMNIKNPQTKHKQILIKKTNNKP